MTPKDKKLTASILISIGYFIGVPFILWQQNYLVLRQPDEVFLILGVTILVLGIKAWITYYAKQTFGFTDHGFQLCLLSAGGFLTMGGLQALNSNIALLGEAIQLGGFIFQLNNFWLIIGGLISLLATLFTALIVNRMQTAPQDVSWAWRLASYTIGILNFTFYLALLVSKGV